MNIFCSDSCDSTSSHKVNGDINKNRTVPAHSIDAILGLKYQSQAAQKLDNGHLQQEKRMAAENFDEELLEVGDKHRDTNESFFEAEDCSKQRDDDKGKLFYYLNVINAKNI